MAHSQDLPGQAHLSIHSVLRQFAYTTYSSLDHPWVRIQLRRGEQRNFLPPFEASANTRACREVWKSLAREQRPTPANDFHQPRKAMPTGRRLFLLLESMTLSPIPIPSAMPLLALKPRTQFRISLKRMRANIVGRWAQLENPILQIAQAQKYTLWNSTDPMIQRIR